MTCQKGITTSIMLKMRSSKSEVTETTSSSHNTCNTIPLLNHNEEVVEVEVVEALTHRHQG
jgi:hypothetical protein